MNGGSRMTVDKGAAVREALARAARRIVWVRNNGTGAWVRT